MAGRALMKAELVRPFGIGCRKFVWAVWWRVSRTPSIFGAAAIKNAKEAPFAFHQAYRGWRGPEWRFPARAFDDRARAPVGPDQVVVDQALGRQVLVAQPMRRCQHAHGAD